MINSDVTVTPFSNGSEYMLWDDINCCRCRKGATAEQVESGEPLPCPIQDAVLIGSATESVPADIARRMGCDEKGHAPRRCGEFEPETEVPANA